MALALLALAPAAAEASVSHAGALAGASRDAALPRSLGHELAPSTLAFPESARSFELFAGDELARVLAHDARAADALELEPGTVGEHALAPLALASRVRELRLNLHQDLSLLGLEPLRGPPELGEDLCQGHEGCIAGTRIGGLELEGPLFAAEKPALSFGLLQACSISSCGLAYGKPLDPLGLRAPNPEDRRYRQALAAAYNSIIAEFRAAGTIGGSRPKNVDLISLQRAREYSLTSFDDAVDSASETDWIVPEGGILAGHVFGVSAFSPDGVRAPGFTATSETSDIVWGGVEGIVAGMNVTIDAAELIALAKGAGVKGLTPTSAASQAYARKGPRKSVTEDPADRRPKWRKATKDTAFAEMPPGSTPETRSCPECGKEVTGKRDPVTGRSDVQLDHHGKKGPWVERQEAARKRGDTRKQINDDYQEDVRGLCSECNEREGGKLGSQRRAAKRTQGGEE